MKTTVYSLMRTIGIGASLTLFATAQNPDTDPSIGFEGNWVMEFSNYPEKGKVDKQYISLSRQWQTYCNGKPFSASQSGAPVEGGNWELRRVPTSPLKGNGGYGGGVPQGGQLSLKHEYFFLGHWGGQSDVRIVGPNEVRGKWVYKDNGGEEVWKRVFPKIKEIEFESQIKERVPFGEAVGKVQTTYSGPGNNMRGNRAGFGIKVFGDNLWGHHVCNITGTDLEYAGTYPITEKNSGKPHDVIGLYIKANIWSKASPGRKTLHVGDIQIPFDLIVKNFPEDQKPAVPELRFVRFANGKFEPAGELRHGDEFCVEAHYNVKPPQPPGKVQLSWTDGQPREVDVTATDDAKLFRSAKMKLEAPAAK